MSKVNNSVVKSNKSHGKKSDKETHTPMLKIFKDMMQLEKNDPEKANLLKEKERNKKRKQYSSSRSKSDLVNNRSCESSGSDHRGFEDMENRQYDVQCHGIKSKLSNMLPGKKPVKTEDTGSCASCALKRLATSEYTCIACLGVLFAITVVAAFCVVFKSPADPMPKMTRAARVFSRDLNDVGLKEAIEDRSDWDDSKLGRYSALSGMGLSDLDDTASRELSAVETSKYSDLSRIIDVAKLNYGKSSDRLKSFYKKLIQTDDQIKNLKKGIIDLTMPSKNSERAKRSLKHHRFRFNRDLNRNDIQKDKNKRSKRYMNFTMPSKLIIEKKKILIHMPHEKKKVPKCSHAPKDSKSHETELKHPFYKHSQRLDELLDKFLDTNLPQILADPFNIGSLFKTSDKVEHATRKPLTSKKGRINVDIFPESNEVSSPNDFFKITAADKSKGGVILGVTTVMTSPGKLPKKSLLERVPNIRKLMQAYEEDEEGLGYDDLKEVLNDDVESQVDTEVRDRNKRSHKTVDKVIRDLKDLARREREEYHRELQLGRHILSWLPPMPPFFPNGMEF